MLLLLLCAHVFCSKRVPPCRVLTTSVLLLLSVHVSLRASNPTVTPTDIESSTQKVADEFAAMGIDLKTAIKGKVNTHYKHMV